MPAEAVETEHREEGGCSLHQRRAGRRHRELHLRITVWEFRGEEDHRAVRHR